MFWRKLFGTRTRWAIIASAGLLLAAITELICHPLASMLCDVPGDPWAALGLLILAATPLVGEWALQSESLPARRLALCMNGAAWIFWLGLSVAIWPAYFLAGVSLPFTPFLLITSVIGTSFSWEGPLIAAFLFLVFTPVITAVVMLCQYTALTRVPMSGLRKPYAWSVFVALCLWGFRPMLLGYHVRAVLNARPEAREKSLTILRVLGGEYDLRMLSYQRRPTLSTALAYGGAIGTLDRGNIADVESARRAYFLLTGKPYTEAPVPPPQMGLFNGNDLLKIEEQGGEKVGSKVAGVTLSASTVETQVERPTRTARSLWTMTFANSNAEGQEARATVRLPENAVISGAWLWIKGEKRPAAFGGKAQVRAAYEEVVKIQRRDPLLVTQTDPRRALVQCFPVPPRGEMQIQLEITQFLDENRLALPALTDTNFTQPEALRHRVSQGDGLEHSLTLNEKQMLQPSPVSITALAPGPAETWRAASEPVALTVAIDTTEQVGDWVRKHKEWLKAATKSLPAGSTVRYIDTRLPEPVQTSSLDEALSWRFTGGVDAVPALATTLSQKSEKHAAIIWIHGPMPAEATDLHTLHLALTENQNARVLGVLTTPGPDPIMDGIAGYKNTWVKDDATPESIAIAASGASSDKAARSPLGGRWPAAYGFAAADSDERTTSLGKLHAWSKTLAGWYSGDRTPELARYAASRRLVTPISGAVVLENMEQYKRHGLDPNKAPEDDPNPQVSNLAPEPGSLVLVVLGIVAAYGYHWRYRARKGTSSSVGR